MSDHTDVGWRRSNLGHLLFAATGRNVGETLRVVHAGGFDGITEAQLALFDALVPDGARLTVLAAHTGVTKQSMIELVDRAAREGLIVRHADPLDARAKRVLITPKGTEMGRAIAQGRLSARDRMARAIGAARLRAIEGSLIAYASSGATAPEATDRILSDAARRFVRHVLGGMHDRGYRTITEAQLALYRTLELGGSRLTDVAAQARITKQSMRALVEQAAALGLVERAADRADGRARTIRFTLAGRTMLGAFRREVEAAEQDFARATDACCLVEVKAALTDYLTADYDAPTAPVTA